MEGFSSLRFKWMLGENLADRNIDPRGVTNVELERSIEFQEWNLVIAYELQLPNGPQRWIASKRITDADAADIRDMDDWMDDEAKNVARQFQGILIPNRHDWFIYLTELLEQVQEEERR